MAIDIDQRVSVADIIAFAVLLILPLVVGVVVSCATGCRRSYNDFLYGGGRMKTPLIAISLVLPYLSASVLLDVPNSIVQRGYIPIFYPVGALIGFLISAMCTMQIVVPLRILSLNEYLRQRFNSTIVALLGCAMILSATATGLTVNIMSTVKSWDILSGAIIPDYITVTSIIGLSLFCSVFGGLRAVVWSCLVQTIVYAFGMIILVVVIQADVGGPISMIHLNLKYGGIHTPVYSFDPRIHDTLWGAVFGVSIHWLASGLMPQALQRMRALPSLPETRIAFLIGSFGIVVLWCLGNINGLGLFAIHAQQLCVDQTMSADNATFVWVDVMSNYVMRRLTVPGFKGIFLAAIFSGTIAAFSAGISAFVAMIWEDLVQSFSFWGASIGKSTIIASFLSILFGTLLLALSDLFISYEGAFLETGYIVMSSTAGAYIGIIILAFLCPQLNNKFVAFAPLVGIGICLWQGLGAISNGITTLPSSALDNKTTCIALVINGPPASVDWEEQSQGLTPFYAIASIWQATIAIIVTILIGVIVGRLKNSSDHVTEKAFLLCTCCRCCKACRANSEMEDGMEDFDWMPHDTVCPIHSLSSLAQRMDTLNRGGDDSVIRNAIIATTSPTGELASETDRLISVSTEEGRPASVHESVPADSDEGSDSSTTRLNNPTYLLLNTDTDH